MFISTLINFISYPYKFYKCLYAKLGVAYKALINAFLINLINYKHIISFLIK